MDYSEVISEARKHIGNYCKACPVCDGKACKNTIPGPGAKGVGDTAVRNYDKWQERRVLTDCICENHSVDTGLTLFGKTFKYPFFAGPVGAVKLHYGDEYDDIAYNDILVNACAENGIAAFTGDGTDENIMKGAASTIAACGGLGIPTIKPWSVETVEKKLDLAKKSGAFAIAMDIDAAGLPFLKGQTPPAGRKSASELGRIITAARVPFIVKGIMTPNSALKAVEAGASGIVVSNHGGRVLDQCPATCEVLESIADAVEGRAKILVDGGIRSGTDVFKALAMGADCAVIARPFVTALYGGKSRGIRLYIEKIASELEDTMMMCGANSLKDINRSMIL